jgi:hypothetical protein
MPDLMFDPMMRISLGVVIFVASQALACREAQNQPEEPRVSTEQGVDPDIAMARVRNAIEGIPGMDAVDIAPVPLLDAGGYRAYSVMPRATREAGEVLFWVGPNDMLSSRQPSEFDELMARMGVGEREGSIEPARFAELFLPFRALRRGVVLSRPDEHPLIQPGSLPEDRFTPPVATWDETGVSFRFWTFDTDHYQPVYWDVRVARDGSTTFANP